MNRKTALAAAAVLLGTTLLLDAVNVFRCGDGLSPDDIGDPFSEANTIRAAEQFASEGFTVNCGLPISTYGNRFPGIGTTPEDRARLRSEANLPDDPVYHGYPPGPEWLCTISIKLFGIGNIALLRIIPVVSSLLASATFLAVMARVFGPWRAVGVYLACLVTPMFTAYTPGLHYQGYALSMLLLELALLMSVMNRTGGAGAGAITTLLLMGFIQGWLSWDYCFVVAFAPVPIALLVTPAGDPIPWRNVLAQCVAAGAGFTMAHILHFTQTLLYLGSLHAAIAEYTFRAGKRYNAAKILDGLSLTGRWKTGLRIYYQLYFGRVFFGRVVSRLAICAVAATLVVQMARLALSQWRANIRITRPQFRELVAVAIALPIGLAWLFARTYHAVNHAHFNIRHFFLFYLACWLVVARATTVDLSRELADPDRDRDRETAGDKSLETGLVSLEQAVS